MTDPAARTRLARALSAYTASRVDALSQARAELKISEMDARALAFIADNPGARPTTLRDALGITSAGVTALVDRLIERDLVRRDLDPTDRRVIHITATVDLTTPPWSALTLFDATLDEALDRADPERMDAFAEFLEELTEHASAS